MLTELALPALIDLGGYGLSLLFIIAILSGRLFTRAHYSDVERQRDKWETAFWKEREASTLQDKQNVELLEAARAMRDFIRAFPQATVVSREDRS